MNLDNIHIGTHSDFFSVATVIVKTVEMCDSGDHMLLDVKRTTEIRINRLCVHFVAWLCVDTVLLALCRYGFIGILLVTVSAMLIFV